MKAPAEKIGLWDQAEDLSKYVSLVNRLRWLSSHRPDAVAVRFTPDGDRVDSQLSYAELDKSARCFAAQLQSLNLTEQRIVIMLPTGIDYLIAFFGCLYAGSVAVPCYPPRPNRSLERLESIVTDANPAAILVSDESLANTRLLKLLEDNLESPQLLSMDFMAEGETEQWVEPPAGQDTLALLQYSSGSTSTPKGIMVSHGNVLHNVQMVAEALAPSEESLGLSWLPLFHDMGLIGGALVPICVGFPILLMAPESFLMRPFRWLHAISKNRVSWSVAPNFAYEYCANKVTAEQRKHLDLSCWQVALVGAEPVRSSTLAAFSHIFRETGFTFEAFYPCYGLAEATLFVTGGAHDTKSTLYEQSLKPTANKISSPTESVEESGAILVSCGWPWREEKVLIVDATTATVCPPGELGEIWVSGPNIALGYWDKPGITRKTFHAKLIGDDRRFLRTGDLGFQVGKELFVTGRIKNMMIVVGRNVHLEDVEHTVSQCHPSLTVGGCAAFSIEKGQTEVLVVVVELERRAFDASGEKRCNGNKVTLDLTEEISSNIKNALTQQHELSVYDIIFVKAGEIPRTSSGKIQHHLCREQYLAGDLRSINHGQH